MQWICAGYFSGLPRTVRVPLRGVGPLTTWPHEWWHWHESPIPVNLLVVFFYIIAGHKASWNARYGIKSAQTTIKQLSQFIWDLLPHKGHKWLRVVPPELRSTLNIVELWLGRQERKEKIMCSRPSGRLRKDEKDKARRWPRQRSREELHSRFQQQQIPAAQTVANHWGGGRLPTHVFPNFF